jgi:type IV secretory pathway VirB3-like protein
MKNSVSKSIYAVYIQQAQLDTIPVFLACLSLHLWSFLFVKSHSNLYVCVCVYIYIYIYIYIYMYIYTYI